MVEIKVNNLHYTQIEHTMNNVFLSNFRKDNTAHTYNARRKLIDLFIYRQNAIKDDVVIRIEKGIH